MAGTGGAGGRKGFGIQCFGIEKLIRAGAGKWVPFVPEKGVLLHPENWFHWIQKPSSSEPRKVVSVLRFAAPVLVPEKGHDFGAVNRFPNNFTEGNRFAAPKSCPLSGTKTGAANRETETSFLVSMEPVFWFYWNQVSGTNGASFLGSMELV